MISDSKIFELEAKRIKALEEGKTEEAKKLEKELEQERKRRGKLMANAFGKGIVP